MSDSARQFNRIVQLVAELSRHEQDGEPALRVTEIAARLGVTPDDVSRDIRTLTAVGDSAEHDWLGSLSVVQEGDTIFLSSRGPFRRPVRLTPDELLAIQVGLVDGDGVMTPLSQGLAEALALPGAESAAISAAESAGPDEARVVDVARHATAERRCVELLYAGSSRRPGRRVIECHRVVSALGKFYLIAWCRAAGAPRVFRADRVLEAKLLEERFAARDGAPFADGTEAVFDPAPDSPRVPVRYSAAIARWVSEQHPEARREADGSVVVEHAVSDPAWLVRTVLQYGPDAEIMGPAEFRTLMRAATGPA